MAAEPYPYLTPQQYLDMDRVAGVKHEYVDGVAYAMAGGTRAHSQLEVRIGGLLDSALRGTECRVYSSDMRVQVEDRYFYPDASVSCDPRDLGPGDILRYPRVIVEVLSEPTEAFDRSSKREMYQRCETLQEYVLVGQTHRSIEVFRLTGDEWVRRDFGPGDMVELSSIGVSFAVADAYEGIDMAQPMECHP